MADFNSVASEFKALIDEHGMRSQEVQDYLDEHPELHRFIESITYPAVGLEIVK